jgi:hypothetical protein
MENILTSVWGWVYSWLQLVNVFVLVRNSVRRSIPSFVPRRSVGMIFCSLSCRRCLCTLCTSNSGHSDRICIWVYWNPCSIHLSGCVWCMLALICQICCILASCVGVGGVSMLEGICLPMQICLSWQYLTMSPSSLWGFLLICAECICSGRFLECVHLGACGFC